MELSGSAYLYTLATLSMTFAGFCAVVIVLCQTIGREVSGFHVVLMRLASWGFRRAAETPGGSRTQAITPLRQRMIEDMNARKLCAGTQRGHIRRSICHQRAASGSRRF